MPLTSEQKQELRRIKQRFLNDHTLGSDTQFYSEALDTIKTIEGFEMFSSQYALNKRKKHAEQFRERTGAKKSIAPKTSQTPDKVQKVPSQSKRVDLLAGSGILTPQLNTTTCTTYRKTSTKKK